MNWCFISAFQPPASCPYNQVFPDFQYQARTNPCFPTEATWKPAALLPVCCVGFQEMVFLPYESVGEVVLNKTYLVRKVGARVPSTKLPAFWMCGALPVQISRQAAICHWIPYSFVK